MGLATIQMHLGQWKAPSAPSTAGQRVERKLLEAAQNGDDAAFGRLIERHQQPLLRYLCRLVRRSDVGQDLCQETFLRAWRHLEKLDSNRSLAPWLYRVATNLALNYLERRSWRFLPLLRRGRDGGTVEMEILSEAAGADELMARLQSIETVQEHLEKLAPHHRAVLLLYYGEDLSCRELARALDVTESAAKVRLFRARKRFKTLLSQRGDS